MRVLIFLLLCLLLPPPAHSATLLETALLKYDAADYKGAVKDFKASLDAGGISAPLAHNIANAEYRAGNEGQAVLWYRRALALDPSLPEARQNLRFLSGKLGFLGFDDDDAAVWPVVRYLRRQATLWQWFWISAWALAAGIVWLAWVTPRAGRRWPLISLISLAGISTLGAVSFLVSRSQERAPLSERHVITALEVSASTAPAEAATTVTSLPPGSEVIPRGSQRGNWIYVEIATAQSGSDDKPLRGWVRADTLEKLWPWSATLVE